MKGQGYPLQLCPHPCLTQGLHRHWDPWEPKLSWGIQAPTSHTDLKQFTEGYKDGPGQLEGVRYRDGVRERAVPGERGLCECGYPTQCTGGRQAGSRLSKAEPLWVCFPEGWLGILAPMPRRVARPEGLM